jgi:hypothetical protein
MFGCYNVETKNIIDALACDGVTFGIQASPREYLTARNIFDNELIVVTILRTALSLATLYSNFIEQTCNSEYKLIHVNREDRTFIFTVQLLEHAISKGINPNIEGDPEYFGFHQDDVYRYGYYFLFLKNLPAYTEKICVFENAGYMHLMLIKEKQKKERELAVEAEEEGEDEENSPGTAGIAGDEHVRDQWKDVKKYTFDMRNLGQLMRINLKLSIKQVIKTNPKPKKCEPVVWDALPR